MIYGLDNNGKKIVAAPYANAVCPVCKSNLISKCGSINIWHWAHEKESDCDAWNEGETEWHLNWKNNFPIDYAEVVINKNNTQHRADICFPNGNIIEFQHSPLSVKEIQERENFYQKMIWVFDITNTVNWDFWNNANKNDPYSYFGDSSNFDMRPDGNNIIKNIYCTFRWKHAKKSIAYAKKPVYLDLGNGKLFQLKKMYPSTPCGGKGYIRDKEEFIDRLKG